MVRDQASTATPPAGYLLPGTRSGMGDVHRLYGRPVASDADLQRDNARPRVSEALALKARYRGQSVVGAVGAAGAVGLFVAWAISTGPWT